MGVGSLRDPRECDGRPPPDAGYYLDLVLPPYEEPRTKIGGRVRSSTWKNITNRVIDLPVKLARTLVNSLANLQYNPRISFKLLANLLQVLLSVAVFPPPEGCFQVSQRPQGSILHEDIQPLCNSRNRRSKE